MFSVIDFFIEIFSHASDVVYLVAARGIEKRQVIFQLFNGKNLSIFFQRCRCSFVARSVPRISQT